MRCPIKDRSEAAADIAMHFDACVDFINSARACNGRALVHCRAGVSRSATVVIGYLMTQCKWDLKTALHHVDTKRFVQPNSGATPLTMLRPSPRHTPSLPTAHPPHGTAHPPHGTASPRHTACAGFINFLIGLERRLFGSTSCSAADFGYAADSGDLSDLPTTMSAMPQPPTPMRR